MNNIEIKLDPKTKIGVFMINIIDTSLRSMAILTSLSETFEFIDYIELPRVNKDVYINK